MTFEELIGCFEGESPIEAKPDGSRTVQRLCPCHDDRRASLTVTEARDGKLLLYCHAGCNTEEVLSSVGLSFHDLGGSYDPPKWASVLEGETGKKVDAVYDYKDSQGKYLYSKVRLRGKDGKKDMMVVQVDREKDRFTKSKGDASRTLYRLPELLKAVKRGFPVFYCEGEKDCLTLRKLGYTATTAGSITDWDRKYARYFIGATVTILADNDEHGQELAEKVRSDLRQYAHRLRVITPSQLPKGDITDYLTTEGGTPESFKEMLREVPFNVAPWVEVKEKAGGEQVEKINQGLLAEYIAKGTDYLTVRGLDGKDSFLLYQDGVYRRVGKSEVKSLVMQYIPAKIQNATTISGVCDLLYAMPDKTVNSDDLDNEENIINLKNGLLDIKTGEFMPHDPSHYLTQQLNVVYDPKAYRMDNFNRYIDDLCRDPEGRVDGFKRQILCEYGGMILSNVRGYRLKKCLVLWSELGNTGKSQYINLLAGMLGNDLVTNISIQAMNSNNKFLLGSIAGKRLISIGDQTNSDVEDSSIFKELTGGDVVTVEQKFKDPYVYRYNGGIILACNNLPNFKDDKGNHLMDRLTLIPCEHYIEDGQRDPEILDKMMTETSAIFNWFFYSGLISLIKHNYRLNTSVVSDNAMREYRRKMDTLFRFIDENCVISGDRADMISRPEFEKQYELWCHQEGCIAVNKANIKDRMAGYGVTAGQGDLDGKRRLSVYRGVRWTDLSEADNVSNIEPFPF